MILQGDITINGKHYSKGSYVSPWKIYPFFLFHMGVFGGSGFAMAYFTDVELSFLYIHGGIAILVYLLFYLTIFGVDEVKWMLINAFLGVFGLYSEIGIILSWADKEISSFPIQVHVVPFMYYVLYTFLLRQIVIEVTNSRSDKDKREKVSRIYLALSLALYIFMYLASNA